MERPDGAADTLLTAGNHQCSTERAVSVEFIASLFRHDGDIDTSDSGWNVTFPGLSLQQDSAEEKAVDKEVDHHSSKLAAEAHAVSLLARPSNQNLRENAFGSFLTLVNARLHAYVRRWPAVASLLQYQITPMTLLSRLEVLSPSSTNTEECDDASNASNSTLAVCCWSMAMDLVLEMPVDATLDGNNDTNDVSLVKSPVISVSFSTLGSISQGTFTICLLCLREDDDDEKS